MTSIEIILAIFVIAAVSAVAFLYHRLQMLRLASQNQSETAKDKMIETFKQLAAETLATNSEQFLLQARGLVEREGMTAKADIEKRNLEFTHLIVPLTKKLEEYQTQLQGLERERVKSYTSVEQELKYVAELSLSLSKETSALKNALKKPHVRGRWGEVQLKNCIELAGMSEYADVTFQNNQVTDDGQRLIPDMTVRMPGGRIVIVDAKTPIDAFLAALEAPEGDLRAAELARHGRHVKDHIKKLSAKAYSENLKSSADFTVMFLPNESFLYAALESEPDLVEFAIQKKILIATPPTFIGLLKVIRFGWNEERLAENAQKISEAGIELHRRMADFAEAYMNVGKSLDKAKQEFEVGLVRMQSRILPQAKKLEQLGAKSNKELLGLDSSGGGGAFVD